MTEVTDDFAEVLKAVRGEFENTKGGKIGNRILAHVFSTVFPVVFLGYLFTWGNIRWPPTGEHWLFISFAILALAVGIVLHRNINSRYVFDDEGIREYDPRGGLKQSIRWKDVERVEFRESRGIKSFTLKTPASNLHLECYKSLSEAIALSDLSGKG